MIEVREATIEDADAIATAHIDGWRVAYRGLVPDEYLDADEFATSRRDRWRSWTWHRLSDSRLFVVTIESRVVGFAQVGPERAGAEVPPQRGEVYAFYVHPTAWGSGVAAALMSRCEEFLRGEGYGCAVLWVLRDNPRARAFYEKVGWVFTGNESTYSASQTLEQEVPEVEYEVIL